MYALYNIHVLSLFLLLCGKQVSRTLSSRIFLVAYALLFQTTQELQELASIQLANISSSQKCFASLRSCHDLCFYSGLIFSLADAGEYVSLDAALLHGMDYLVNGSHWDCLSAGIYTYKELL